MLSIEQLGITRRADGIDFQVMLPSLSLEAGHILVIQGDSGCGKSTLLEMIGMILKPDNIARYQLDLGKNHLDLVSIMKQNQQDRLAQIRACYFGFIPQTGGLLPFLTIKDNLLLPLRLLRKAVDKTRLQLLSEKLGIAHLLQKYPKQLSIGERQRASFIRAIIHKPVLLLADEPTSALDPYNANLLFNLIIEQAKVDNIAAIIVTHEQQLAKQKGLTVLAPELTDKQKAVFTINHQWSNNE